MSTEKTTPRITVLLLLMIIVAAMRIPNAAQITPWANFTPIGAMGLFGGSYFKSRWQAFAFPLLTLFVSDLIINNVVFQGKYGVMYNGWYIIYSIFILIVFFGKWLIEHVTTKNIILASVAAALSHWLIADFTVWIGWWNRPENDDTVNQRLGRLISMLCAGISFYEKLPGWKPCLQRYFVWRI